HAHFKDKTQTSYQTELNSLPPDSHIIISAEFLHSRVVAPEDIERFRDLFCTGFDRVTVVVYIRPQLDHVISLYSTVLKAGGYRASLEHFINSRMHANQRPYFDLKHLVSR